MKGKFAWVSSKDRVKIIGNEWDGEGCNEWDRDRY